jgi:hypothetical protein
MTPGDITAVRRPMAAGHVLVALIVGLIVGAFLNAPGILKTAKSQRVGIRRDVATAFAQPLYDMSHFFHIDRVRVGLKDLLGRTADDKINDTLPSPTTTLPPTATTLPAKTRVAPASPLQLWLGGDSLGETPGTSVINALGGNADVDVVAPVDTHISTGLARPEVFNWPDHVAQVIRDLNPTALVLSLGSNDNQPMTGAGSESSGSFGSDSWKTEYARRVGGLMDTVLASGPRTLFWLGVPIVRQDSKLESYRFINGIIRAQAELRPGRVFFIDTYTIMADADGNYADYLPNESGELVQARAPDGTHYTRFGGDRIAAAVVLAMNDAYVFGTDVVTAPSTPPTTATTIPAGRSRRTTSTTRLP